jgi:broad specificity phosphatase PhoE
MVVASHPGERLAVVTHAGVVSQALGALARTSAARWESFRPGNTAITELRFRGEIGVVTRFDDRAHLAAS